MTFPKGLFEQQKKAITLVRRDDPVTSYKAAEDKVASGTIASDQNRILAVLRSRPDFDEYRPGWTNAEIAFEITGRPEKGKWYYKVARRTGELKRDGRIKVVCERTSAIGGGEMTAYRLAEAVQDERR